MRRTVCKLAVVLAAGAMLVGSSQALAATGPLKTTCATAWEGNAAQSSACAVLWWDASTHQVSARCSVEYSFSGVQTEIFHCQLQQGKGQTFESAVADFGTIADTTTAGQTYTFSTEGVEPKEGHTYSVHFTFQPSQGNSTGPQRQVAISFIHVLPMVTGVSPNTASKAGGTVVTVTGEGFALGTTATVFKFGSTTSTSVNCTSTTQCTVIGAAHARGKVDVKATVNKISSEKNRPADQFTYA